MTNRTCETCMHSIIYAELDDEMNLNHDKQFYVCMLTDADTEPNDTCLDWETICSTCIHDGLQGSSIGFCDICVNGSEYQPKDGG